MKLIVGLGNPGKKYATTRHNTGFMFVDNLANKLNVKFKVDTALLSMIATCNIDNEKVYIIKPQTYMNLSGEAVYRVANYYKINIEDILIIQDDLDLDVGAIRFRRQGSSGGHNGIKNIIENLGTDKFARLKVGISKVDKEDTIDYVLGEFSKDELITIQSFADKTYDMVCDFIKLDFEMLMSRYNVK